MATARDIGTGWLRKSKSAGLRTDVRTGFANQPLKTWFWGASSSVTAPTIVNSLTIDVGNLPSKTFSGPTGVAVGDTLHLYLDLDSSRSVSSLPGWTLKKTFAAHANGGPVIYIYERTATSADADAANGGTGPASYTITFSAWSSCTAILVAYRGTAGIGNTDSTNAFFTSTITSRAISASAGSLVLSIWSGYNALTSTPSGVTNLNAIPGYTGQRIDYETLSAATAATTTRTYVSSAGDSPTLATVEILGTASAGGATGTASGTVSLSGSASGLAIISGLGAGSVSLTGVSSGTALAQGAAAGTISLDGSSAGIVGSSVTGIASGSVTLSGASSGAARVQGVASGLLSLTGSASGTAAVQGQGAGTITLTGAVAGAARAAGSASGSVTLSGTAAGAVPALGTASGSVSLSGSAAGAAIAQGQASGSVTLTGSAVGTTTPVTIGTASGTVTLTGSASGVAPARGTASGSVSVTGSASGIAPEVGQGSGSLSLTGSASGTVAVRGAAAGALPLTGAASGIAPSLAQGVGQIAVTGAAAGSARVAGSAAGSIAVSGAAAGNVIDASDTPDVIRPGRYRLTVQAATYRGATTGTGQYQRRRAPTAYVLHQAPGAYRFTIRPGHWRAAN